MNKPNNSETKFSEIIRSQETITHLVADLNYTIVFFENGRYHVYAYTLKKFQKEFLSNPAFSRIHRKYMVNSRHIKAYEGSEVILTNGLRLPVARRRRV